MLSTLTVRYPVRLLKSMISILSTSPGAMFSVAILNFGAAFLMLNDDFTLFDVNISLKYVAVTV